MKGRALFLFQLVCFAVICHCSAKQPSPEFFKALKDGAYAQINLHVEDDLGAPVDGVKVQATLASEGKDYSLTGLTDQDGHFVVSGTTTGDYLVIFCEKAGYYTSRISWSFIAMGKEHEVKDGKWRPYGENVLLTIRKIRNPCSITHGNVTVDVPATNVWMGYDAKAQNFTRPYGCGDSADFEVQVEWDGKPPASSKLCRAEIRFPSPFGGGYRAPTYLYSKYPYPYAADAANTYGTSRIDVVNRDGDAHTTKRPFGDANCFVFRSRCKVGNDGKLASANYGNIVKFDVSPSWRGVATLTIEYMFNPVPNDTNLEPIQWRP